MACDTCSVTGSMRCGTTVFVVEVYDDASSTAVIRTDSSCCSGCAVSSVNCHTGYARLPASGTSYDYHCCCVVSGTHTQYPFGRFGMKDLPYRGHKTQDFNNKILDCDRHTAKTFRFVAACRLENKTRISVRPRLTFMKHVFGSLPPLCFEPTGLVLRRWSL